MNFKFKFFISLLILSVLLSAACVSAEAEHGQDMMASDDEGIQESPDEGGYKSFNNLSQDMNDADKVFDVNDNYKWVEGDPDDSITVYKENLTINGNGHIIDGSGVFSGFNFEATTPSDDNKPMFITINDLTFKNINGSAISLFGGNVTLNNVNFTGCCNSEAYIFYVCSNAYVTLNGCNFHSNTVGSLISLSGSRLLVNSTDFSDNIFAEAITVDNAKLIINNSIFSANNRNCTAIEQNRGQLIIQRSNFTGFNSKQGGIIGYKGDHFTLKDSRFTNSRAELNGGAIIAKYFPLFNMTNASFIVTEDFVIDGCTFSNLSAANDGGAIYIDMDSGSGRMYKNLNITNSNFIDCTSGYGGAIAVQGSRLNVVNSNFINNSATVTGGAIYMTWANATVVGSSFIGNSAKRNAGAVYFDKGRFIIRQSNFTSNKALGQSSMAANAIYANDVEADFANSTFENGGIAVYANFAKNSKINIDTKDTFLMDNKDYVVSVETSAIKLNLVGNSIVVDKLPSKFDARDYGWVTPVKLQGDNFDCWAFATVASIETSLGKATGQAFNLSQNYIQKLQLKYYPAGDLRISLTGFAYSGLGYALSWLGTLAMDAPYDDRGMILDADPEVARIHLQDAMFITAGRNDTNELIKRAILEYGAVSVQLILGNQSSEISSIGDDISSANHNIHFISLIGWDDGYKADGTDPAEDTEKIGAWITKDSEVGFAHIFYDDEKILAVDNMAIVPQNPAIAYIFENTIDYHVNYQTDLTGLTGFDGNYTIYSNEFTSKYDELIGAVGTYFNESGINYSFDVYVNGVKVHSQTGVSEFGGFRTIVLDKYLPIRKGDTFKVVFRNNNLPYQAFSRQHYVSGMSYVSVDGKSWSDITLQNRTVCLKVYTVKDDTKIINNKDISVDYDGGSYFTVRVVTADGHAVGAGAIVKFTIGGKTYSVVTDNDGIAKLKITQTPKKYAITTSYNGKTYKNTVTVKQVLTASKVTIKKKTAKKLVLKAKLKINGKLVKGKKITFKFKGKKYTVKTNKKGVAKKTLKKKVIKKLKKGKKYTVKVTYLKDTIKTTVKVK